MGRLFGTDGIRGVAHQDLTADLARRLGDAVGRQLAGPGGRVLIGRDTRESGPMLSAAVADGLTAGGTDVLDLGVVTTPCLVWSSARDEVAAGIMVSASHNPAADNGLKVVAGGRKLPDEAEDRLEALILGDDGATPAPGAASRAPGTITRDSALQDAYLAYLRAMAGEAFAGLRIGIDCANGSASAIAPALMAELGAEVVVRCVEPDGMNINAGCGSTHPEPLAALVVERHLDLGLAFDGDADRLIAVDERGRIVDGDAVMAICATARLAAGTLRNGLLVATVLSNGGLERAVEAAGGRVLRTPVGDRAVLEAMEREGADLGGEQSGHVIFRDVATTGDGLVTAIQLVRTLRDAGGARLSELADRMPRLPQVMLNSAARHRAAWAADPTFSAAVAAAEAQLGGRGRILVRPSGTEPKLRIMVEGDDADEIGAIAETLQRLAEARLN